MLAHGSTASHGLARWPRPIGCIPARVRLAHTHATKTDNALLYWATEKNALCEQLPVSIEHGEFGRCLFAHRDIQPDEVILSVCTDHVFISQAAEDLEMHWAAEMALRLLQTRHACRTASDSSNDNSSNGSSCSSSSGSFWRLWIDSLPQRVVTPVEFTANEVQQLVFPNAVEAVLNMRQCLEDCYEVLQPQLAQIDCGWKDFLWAVQTLHSRCFFEPSNGGRHLAVPGIDMCNHSSTAPNAGVRLIHSPGACQGLSALEDVAPAALTSGLVTNSYFQLVAGPEGIAAGDQVCISYGSWPAEPFLLLFGFVPQPNPEDCIILFNNLQHMAMCYLGMLFLKSNMSNDSDMSAVDLLQDEGFRHRVLEYTRDIEQQQQAAVGPEAGPYAGFQFMFVKQSDMDGRLNHTIQMLHHAVAAAAAAAAAGADDSSSSSGLEATAVVRQLQQPVGDLIVYRLEQLVRQLSDSVFALQQQQQQQQQQGCQPDAVEEKEGDIQYAASVDHAALAQLYCSSKRILAEQLLRKYSDPISMMIAAGASRR